MGNVVNLVTALKNDPAHGAASSDAGRRREDVMQDVKLALIGSELTLDEPRNVVDPYNARLGRSARDVWDRGRRHR